MLRHSTNDMQSIDANDKIKKKKRNTHNKTVTPK